LRLFPLNLRHTLPALTVTAVTALFGCATVSTPTPSPTHAFAPTLSLTQLTRDPTSAKGICKPNPMGKRELYLRGTFNSWNAVDVQRFTYFCDHFELVTHIKGAQSFKVGDEEWSADADFGVDKSVGPPWQLVRKGKGIEYAFTGTHRLRLNMTDANSPTLNIAGCDTPPLGETTLYLRGGMNNWTALDDYAFQFSCDAYYLNVKLQGRQEFKIADAANTNATTFGTLDGAADGANDQPQVLTAGEAGRTSNINFTFDGEQTIRLAYAGNRPVMTIGAKTFADPKAVAVTDPVALSVVHNSRMTSDKSPFGASPTGTKFDFSLTAGDGVSNITLVIERRRLEGNQDVLEYTELARVPMSKVRSVRNSVQNRWHASHAISDIGVYGYYFEVVIGDKTFIYQNNRDSVYWTREKGSNGLGLVGEKPTSNKTIRRFRQTVFAKDFVVPSWAKDAVYYYIFPERFRNGNKRNDPKPGVTTYQNHTVEFHQNWLDKPYKPKTGDGSDDLYNNDFFGGDLEGIIEKLDYIADLGANTIYMTPVFQASSNHKYDTADYKKIDPHFGTNADFERLTREATKRGIRVIPDTSLNHVGSDSIYFDRYGKYKSQGAFENTQINRGSPYADWFKFDETQTDPDKKYKGWVDVTDLPEVNKALSANLPMAQKIR
jgi:cyclomaltodextrinase / maltogenic alpha-amylase / neopullulanase